MRTVWLDEVFAVNFAADLIALAGAGRLCAARIRPARLILGTLLGALYACTAEVVPSASSLPVRLAVGALMALCVYGAEEKLLRVSAVFCLVSASMAGIALGVSSALGETGTLSLRTLTVTLALSLAALGAIRRLGKRLTKGGLHELKLEYSGKEAVLTALADTGNALRDPVGGSVLPVVETGKAAPLFGEAARRVLEADLGAAGSMERLYEAAPALRCRLVPYSAVGVEKGLLLAVRLDAVMIDGKPLRAGWVALSPTKFTDSGEYSALVGGQ